MNELVKIAHKGKPCDPPIVNGVAFSLVADDVWVGEATLEQADALLRVTSYRLFGGAPAPAPAPAGDGKPPVDPQAPTGDAKPPAGGPDPDGDGDKGDGFPSDAEVDALTSKAAVDALGKGEGIELTSDRLQGKKDELKAALKVKREALAAAKAGNQE